jgi:hypothetical protein
MELQKSLLNFRCMQLSVHFVCSKTCEKSVINMTGDAIGAGTAYPSEAPEFTPGF